ncbi:hypothetical protein [Paenirhodobacter populi]|uniref:hypothetical protein n=1 Tax=Paenirhodobacter populi TaxID=2306993 RepID=UPI0013E332CB|nr:hypothetical protein [Sinirhodobacter populi]
MDYGKSGGPKVAKNAPRHLEHNQKGSEKNPFGETDPKSKAALLERMKSAAEKRRK